MPFRALSPDEFEAEAGDAFRRVFASTDPCDAPFTAAMSDRAIFWGSYALRESDFLALAEVGESVGDRGCYVTMIERGGGGPEEWYFPFADPAAYLDHTLVRSLENALFSPGGRWGMVFSNGGHVVLGAEPPLVDAFLDRRPGGRESVIEWLRDMKEEGEWAGHDPLRPGSWVEPLLLHVYGEKRTNELLVAAGLR